MAILSMKIAFLLLLGVCVALAAPAPDSRDMDSIDILDDDEEYAALEDSRIDEADFDDDDGDSGDDDDSHVQGARAASFWGKAKDLALGAAKAAAKHLAGQAASAMGGKRSVSEEELYSKLAPVSEQMYETIGKRMAIHSMIAAQRAAGPSPKPFFISSIKNGAKAIWKKIGPTVKDAAKAAAKAVAGHLSSYANGKRSGDLHQEIADVSETVGRRSADQILNAARREADPFFLSNLAGAVKGLIGRREGHADPFWLSNVLGAVKGAIGMRRREAELAERAADPFFLSNLAGAVKGLIGRRQEDNVEGRNADPFFLSNIIGAVKGAIGRRRRDAELTERDADPFFLSNLAGAVKGLIGRRQGEHEARDADPFFLSNLAGAVKGLIGRRQAELAARDADPFFLSNILGAVKGAINARRNGELEGRDPASDPFFISNIAGAVKGLIGKKR